MKMNKNRVIFLLLLFFFQMNSSVVNVPIGRERAIFKDFK